MSLHVRAAPQEHYPWVVNRAGFAPVADMRAIEAIDERTGTIKGMTAYCNWTPSSCQMHFASDSPLSIRALVFAEGCPAFAYPFLECGLSVVTATVRASNRKALDIYRKLGFRELCRVPDGSAVGEDLVLISMRREECTFLQPGEANG